MRRRALPVIYLAVFVDMLGFGIILPLLPFHAEQLGGTGLWVGGVLTAYAAAQFVAGPVLGLLSDRFGRRPVLLAALLGSAVSLALTGLANSLLTLFAARLVAGLCGGAIPVGQAYVVDLTEPRERTKALGMVGASIGMGFVFGPGLGAALSGLGFAGVCFVAGGIALANFLAGLVLLPRQAPARTAGRDGESAPRNASPAVLVAALRIPSMRPVLVAIFAGTFAFTGMEATYALLGERLYDLGPAGLGVIFTGVGLVMAAVQGGLVGRLSARYGDRRVAIGGTLLMAVGLVALPLGVTWLNHAGLAVLAAGQGLMTTATSALIAEAAGAALGSAFGVGQSSSAAARAIGPVAAGAAFDAHFTLPFYLGAVLCAAAALLLRRRTAPAPEATGPRAAEAVRDDRPVS